MEEQDLPESTEDYKTKHLKQCLTIEHMKVIFDPRLTINYRIDPHLYKRPLRGT